MHTALILIVISLTLGSCIVSGDKYSNKFNTIYGCKQTVAVNNYNHAVEYIPTEYFEYTGTGTNSSFFRFGIVGPSDGVIRFSKVPMPYNKNVVHEIVLGLANNQFTEIRRQTRFNAASFVNHQLTQIPTPNILSETEPFVFVIEFGKNGIVRLIRDGEKEPFVEFSDPTEEISFAYVGFSNWVAKVIYFFDCPVASFDLLVISNDLGIL
ncbi:uncharacterized protein LOC129747460 [Uranotaenia lowii]|uniref:uncharacterized protein LOC129747460 n=1 Tax=Uranotaenia lowii TaxID=190385 RepID=UPI0024784150|nr:uncharacterized protein LOC129747460 [Uranotaenia lowii]